LVLKSHDLLTIDATIIAGLMILLSIQITTPFDKFLNEQSSLHDKESDLELQKAKLHDLLMMNYSSFSIGHNMSIDQSELRNVLTSKAIELKEIELELNSTKAKMKSYDDNSNTLVQLESLSLNYNRFITLGMVVPFVLSAIFETYFSSVRKDGGDDANKKSLVITYVGFVILMVGLYLKLGGYYSG